MKTKIFMAVVVAGMAASSAAFADVIKGEILSTDTIKRTLSVKVQEGNDIDAIKAGSSINLAVSADTQFEGALLDEFRIGDIILADLAKGPVSDLWSVRRIQIDKLNLRNAEEVAASPENKY